MTAPAAARSAGATVADVLAARYPHLSPGQCRLLETAILRQLAVAAGRACALAAVWPQPDGALHISVLIIASGSCPASPCLSPAASRRPDLLGGETPQ